MSAMNCDVLGSPPPCICITEKRPQKRQRPPDLEFSIRNGLEGLYSIYMLYLLHFVLNSFRGFQGGQRNDSFPSWIGIRNGFTELRLKWRFIFNPTSRCTPNFLGGVAMTCEIWLQNDRNELCGQEVISFVKTAGKKQDQTPNKILTPVSHIRRH